MKSISIEDVPAQHPAGVFYEFYRENCAENGILDWRVFKPMQYPKILPWMLVADKVPPPPSSSDEIDPHRDSDWMKEREYRLRYRLCGTGHVGLMGRDQTGRLVGELQSSRVALNSYEMVAKAFQEGMPVAQAMDMPAEGREFIKVYLALFPALRTAEDIHVIVGLIAPIDMRVDDD